MVLGGVFIVLGALVHSFPVPITIVAMVLVVAYVIGLIILDPANIGRGIVIKVIVIVALAKAIQAAFAYEREKRKEEWGPA